MEHKHPGAAAAATAASSAEAAMRAQRVAAHRRLLERKYQEQTEHIKKEIHRRMEAKAAKNDAKFAEMFASVMAGIDGGGGGAAVEQVEGDGEDLNPVVEANIVLREAEINRQQRSAAMFDKWQAEVFDQIQAQVEAQVGRLTREDIEQKHCHFYDLYLAAADRKPVFRDIVTVEDYDPFESLNYTVKYSTRGIKDPLKHDLSKTLRETVDLGGMAPPQRARAREILPPTFWTDDKHRSTVWGHIVDPQGNHIHLSGNPMRTHSKVTMDHYAYEKGKEVLSKEFPRGKPILPERRGFFAPPRGKAVSLEMKQRHGFIAPLRGKMVFPEKER